MYNIIIEIPTRFTLYVICIFILKTNKYKCTHILPMKISIYEILYEQISLSTDYWLVDSGIIYIKNVVNIMQICKENGSIYLWTNNC